MEFEREDSYLLQDIRVVNPENRSTLRKAKPWLVGAGAFVALLLASVAVVKFGGNAAMSGETAQNPQQSPSSVKTSQGQSQGQAGKNSWPAKSSFNGKPGQAQEKTCKLSALMMKGPGDISSDPDENDFEIGETVQLTCSATYLYFVMEKVQGWEELIATAATLDPSSQNTLSLNCTKAGWMPLSNITVENMCGAPIRPAAFGPGKLVCTDRAWGYMMAVCPCDRFVDSANPLCQTVPFATPQKTPQKGRPKPPSQTTTAAAETEATTEST